MPVIKALAIHEDASRPIPDLKVLAVIAHQVAERTLHHTRFRVLPKGVEYNPHYGCYTVLIEIEDAVKKGRSFDELMTAVSKAESKS